MKQNRMPGYRRIGLFIALAFSGQTTLALTLDEALSRAEHAPEVLASKANEAALMELSKSAGQLPDPRFVVTVDDFMLEGAEKYRSTRMAGVMQEIPASSRRDAERRGADAVLREGERMREIARLAAAREVSLLWLKLYFLTRKEALLQTQSAEVQRRREAATAALAGGGKADAALESSLDKQMVEDDLDLLRRDLRVVRAGLARWVGKLDPNETASGELPEWVRNVKMETPPGQEETRVGNDEDPEVELRASRARVGIAEAELDAARASKDLDWSVEFGLGRDAEGDAMSMAKIGISLPLFAGSRQNPRITAARLKLQAAEASHAAQRAEFMRQRRELLAEDAALGALLTRLNKETLPLLERRVALAEAALAGGRGASVDLVQLREKRLATRIRAIELEADRAAVRAKLHFLQQRSGETS
jgi:outer membrane protein TolC